MHSKIEKKIFELGIVPVVAIQNAKNAVPLAKALLEGGLQAAEITFRTEAAEESIQRIRNEVPGMLVGAGTVLTIEQVDKALDAGASFLMTPGFNPEIVRHAKSRAALIMPGTATPGEMEQAMALGLHIVKFFPAELNGGVRMLKTVRDVYPNLKFIPTGGIHAGNLQEYLSMDSVIACGGTWMVKSDLIESGSFAEITRLAKEAVACAQKTGIERRVL